MESQGGSFGVEIAEKGNQSAMFSDALGVYIGDDSDLRLHRENI